MVHAVLGGTENDATRAGQVLAYELDRHHVALALWADDATPAADATARLEALAGDIGAALGTRRLLSTASGVRGLWAWIGSDTPVDLSALDAWAGAPARGLQVAAGRVQRGLQGFRESHREALAAQRIALRSRRPSVLTRHADVEVAALVSTDELALRRFVERELSGLLAGDASTARLRDTALVFLQSGANARVAAERLGTHKNTVLYRLHRIEELFGRPIDERRLQLELALTAVDAIGEPVLPAAGPTLRR